MMTRHKKTATAQRTSLTRRRFLAQSLAAPLLMPAWRIGGVSMTTLSAGVTNALAQTSSHPRSLVCLFLAGGADSFNLIVPSNAGYSDYLDTRGDLAVGDSDLIDIGDDLALHRSLPTFQRLYAARQLAVIANVGPLARPTTQADYRDRRNLPESLFAHNTQQKLWQTAANSVSGTNGFGWGGAIANQVASFNAGASVGGAFSMAGDNAWQSTSGTRFTSLNPNIRIQRLFGLDPEVATWIAEDSRLPIAERLAALYRDTHGSTSLMAGEAAGAVQASLNSAESLYSALEETGAPGAPTALGDWQVNPANRLEAQLHLVTRLIAARESLGLSRQLFFVRMGGWDTHSNQNERFPVLLNELDGALASFTQALDTLGFNESVTTFTASDFGRTLTSNGNGTDHGWGGHAFAFGGTVNGGALYGEMPNFSAINNPDEAGDGDNFAGRLIPTQSVNQYGATLARWMGVDDDGLNAVFPDLANFATQDLGFLNP